VLACGAQMKGSFCLAKGERAFVSQHLGDLDDWATFTAWRDGIDHFQRLFAIAPVLVAHDLHPEYRSTRWALALEGVEREAVQHHHAHAAACLADHGVTGASLAVCFDGLGFGDDGTLWGGEILVADLAHYERVARLAPVPLPGGTAAIRAPWRMAAAYLDAAFEGDVPDTLAVMRRNTEAWSRVVALARSGVRSLPTSGAGRLFDAVGALVAGRDVVSYEGQAAIELEELADPTETGAYEMRIGRGALAELHGADLVRSASLDLCGGTPPDRVSARFHNGLANAVAAACVDLSRARGLRRVALTGGSFQNALLAERCAAALERAGLAVLRHALVPPNDAGIAYGQAVVAAARDRLRGGAPNSIESADRFA
jgi:hydrogenase maturation protein HypF